MLRPEAAQRLVPKLTSLELGALDDVWVRALRVQLARAPRLRRLAIMRAQSFALLVEAVLQDAKSLERLEVREVLITAQELVRAQRALAKASSTLVVELGPFGSPDLSVVFTRDDAELCGTPRASARSKLEGQRLLSELERLKRGA